MYRIARDGWGKFIIQEESGLSPTLVVWKDVQESKIRNNYFDSIEEAREVIRKLKLYDLREVVG